MGACSSPRRSAPVWLVTQQGAKTPVANVPAVLYQGQGGMLGVFLSPHYATDHNVYLTYSEPGDGGSSLALARARLAIGEGTASLDGLRGAVAPDAEGQGRTVRRRRSPFLPTASICS